MYDFDNPILIAGEGMIEYLPEEDDGLEEDMDGELVVACYHYTGLRLDIDFVRSWGVEDAEAVEEWIGAHAEADGRLALPPGAVPLLAIPRPPAIAEAIAEYAAARKCRACGCTESFACPGGCTWVGPDLCSACGGMAEA